MPKTIENKYLYVYLHHSLLAPIPKCHREGSHELTPKFAHGLYRMDPQKTYQKHVFAKNNRYCKTCPIYFPLAPPINRPLKAAAMLKASMAGHLRL